MGPTVRHQTNRNVRELPVSIFLTRAVPTTRSNRPASVELYKALTCDRCLCRNGVQTSQQVDMIPGTTTHMALPF